MAVFYSVSQVRNNSTSDREDDEITEKIVNIAPYTIIYGSWTEKNSVIFAYDLSTGKEAILARLPKNIKKIHSIDSNSLVYISQTNVRDQGRVLAKYDLASKKETVLFQASDGFFIDDYVISPDKQRIAIWEVANDADSGTLTNGKARVYTALLGQTTKNLIYDENVTLTTPIHFPLSITNQGKVFYDTVIPNTPAGWAYGMSMSNFTGTEKQDIASMRNGTYSMYPVPSSDGAYFVFGGYDGTLGSGTVVLDGFRRALTHTNTIEYLDTNTLQRVKIPNSSSNTRYGSSMKWIDEQTFTYDSFGDPSGEYVYTIPQPESVMQQNEITKKTLAKFAGISLVGTPIVNTTAIGTLGNNYELSYSMLEIYLPQSEKESLPLSPALIQFISLVNSDYIDTSNLETLKDSSEFNSQQLQLQTFVVKSEVYEERRETLRETTPPPTVVTIPPSVPNPNTNNPAPLPPPPSNNTPIVSCESLAERKCSSILVGNHTSCDDPRSQICADYLASLKKYDSCYASEVASQKSIGACVMHPLYLYGEKGTEVDIQIHTPIYNSNISNNGNYTFTLGDNGTFYHQENAYSSLNFDYTSSLRRLHPLTRGYIVAKKDIHTTVRKIGLQFGLNEKETQDTVNDISSKITSEYVFISFYDHETSHALLPITFNPKPDVYRNITFYVKNLDKKPQFSVKPPKIDKINRHGFTAIEIGTIIE
jgi:hypothetical protein